MFQGKELINYDYNKKISSKKKILNQIVRMIKMTKFN